MPIGRSRPERGFTYLWLLFVVALGGVALAALGQRQQTGQQREREAELRFRGEAIAAAIASYMRASPAGTNSLPQRLEDLLEDKRSGVVQRHLRRLYADPFTGRSDWELIQGQVALKPPAQESEAVENQGLLPKKQAWGPSLGAATISAEQGAPVASGIVGVSSRSKALLLATGALAQAAKSADALDGPVADLSGKPNKAHEPNKPHEPDKLNKPRVFQLQFLAASEVLQPE